MPKQEEEAKNAEDLTAGDVFVYRKIRYAAVSGFTDKRHTQTILTAFRLDAAAKPPGSFTTFRFFRTCKLPVVGRHPIKLTVVLEPRVKITSADEIELEQKLRTG